MNNSFILFDNSFDPHKKSLLLTEPITEFITSDFNEIDSILDNIHQAPGYKAGFLAYEASYPNLGITHPTHSVFPLVWFMSFSRAQEMSDSDVKAFLQSHADGDQASSITDFLLNESFSIYQEKIHAIKEHMKKGETYQVNYTMGSSFNYKGNPYQLYSQLRKSQPVEYGAFIQFRDFQSLSFSPELFFRKNKETISSKPMKGTMARAKDSSTDQLIIQQMKQDEKIISENLMIVDMIRNDLARIAQPGTVKVDELFTVETYKTIHQMTSTISAQVDPSISLREIINNIFPCASITGAPKKSTMEIIRQLESETRRLYTGAIGFLTPENDMCFNVPIRTLVKEKDHYSMGLGGGILYDSHTSSEYQEIKDKAQFLRFDEHFYLFETMLYDGRLLKLDDHLNRIQNSAQLFSFPFSRDEIATELNLLNFSNKQRIKLLLYSDGQWKIETQELSPRTQSPKVRISGTPMNSKDIKLKHKNSQRSIYDKEWAKAQEDGYYDVLYFNEKSELTEASRHNVFLEIQGTLYTPPIEAGLLPGVMRQELILKGAKEKFLNLEDIKKADKIFLTNALRGIVEVKLQ